MNLLLDPAPAIRLWSNAESILFALATIRSIRLCVNAKDLQSEAAKLGEDLEIADRQNGAEP